MVAPPLELMLLKQVASYLATPIFVVDADGALDYYNEPAEVLLGRRYEETGRLSLEEWGRMWRPTDEDGQPLRPEDLPLAVATRERRPAQGSFSILGSDGVSRRLTVTAIPLDGRPHDRLGAVALFWES